MLFSCQEMGTPVAEQTGWKGRYHMLLREKAYRRFKESLFANRLKPGQFVSQRELSEMLDVPLGPMREAIQRLAANGLMKIIAQRGIQILEPTPQMVKEAYELRIILEIAAIKMVPAVKLKPELTEIESRTRDLQNRLAFRPDANGAALKTEDVEPFLSVDWELHELLIRSMDNRTIFNVYQINADKVRIARLRQKFTIEQMTQVLDEHLSIIEALMAGETDKAVGQLEKHLKIALKRGLGFSSLFSF